MGPAGNLEQVWLSDENFGGCPLSSVFALLATGLALATFAHAPVTTTVQFDREIVHILDDHCVMCHSDEASAFPLLTYEQTYAVRWKIRQDALDGHMAPWAAVPGYGEFANSNSLTQREVDFLVSWAESYGPRNNGAVYSGAAATASVPKVIQAHIDFDRWVLGFPDLQLTLRASTQHAIVDSRLTADRWLRGVEYKPADRHSVHFVSFTIEETGQWIGSWTRGSCRRDPTSLPRFIIRARLQPQLRGMAHSGCILRRSRHGTRLPTSSSVQKNQPRANSSPP